MADVIITPGNYSANVFYDSKKKAFVIGITGLDKSFAKEQ